MLYSKKISVFGHKLKQIRESNQLSRNEVELRTGITYETLRRLEKGDYLPQIATIEILSKLYKVNLLVLLEKLKMGTDVDELFLELNNLMLCNTDNRTTDLLGLKERTLYALQEDHSPDLQELLFLIDILLEVNEAQDTGNQACKFSIIQKIKDGICQFAGQKKSSNIALMSLNRIECHLVFTLSVVLADIGEIEESSALLENIIRSLEYPLFNNQHFLFIKSVCNLSYNYHIRDRHQQVIAIVDNAIQVSLKQHSNFLLYFLYYRLAVSHFTLGNKDTAIEHFTLSALHLKITQNDRLYRQYCDMTREKYSISLEAFIHSA